MNSEMLEQILKQYFSKQKNIDYIMKKTSGSEQSIKIYEIICMMNNPDYSKEDNLVRTINFLKNDKLLWSHPIFDVEKQKMIEENDFMVCPYEISEGALKCSRCSCKKIFSFSKQTRSIDEPATVFARCSECGHRWSEGS
jgi:DNA-directed RNA polymerase subunit M/transcription elongation factor TFIIS